MRHFIGSDLLADSGDVAADAWVVEEFHVSRVVLDEGPSDPAVFVALDHRLTVLGLGSLFDGRLDLLQIVLVLLLVGHFDFRVVLAPELAGDWHSVDVGPKVSKWRKFDRRFCFSMFSFTKAYDRLGLCMITTKTQANDRL